MRLFASKLGMRLIAAAGDIDIRALSANVNVLAKLQITETAEVIRIHASKQLEVSGGGSYARWSAGGIEMGSAGPCTVRSSMWSLIRPANVPVPALPQAVEGSGDLIFNIGQQAGSTRLLAGEPYELLTGSSVVATGVTDDMGRLLIKGHKEGTAAYTVRLADGSEFRVPVSARPEPSSHLARRGYRNDDSATDLATPHGLSD